MHKNTQLGSQAEELVALQLTKKGFAIMELNYKQKFGEIDVIARKDSLLIFVEVKMRTNNHFDLAEVITHSKQQKIIRTASHYLAYNKYEDSECRFDVALVQLENNMPQITYIPNAFEKE
ncbi:MAG: YraN family protein [Candidatus Dependentiae bacterium]|nr:YraN family protein [Candidatus Dependentiae bacterium]